MSNESKGDILGAAVIIISILTGTEEIVVPVVLVALLLMYLCGLG